MSQSAIAVANFFVRKAISDGADLTPMKLLKLVYIAHGWHLGLNATPLIGEPVEAWKFGPVIRSVYHAFKDYGSKQVEREHGSKCADAPEHPFLDRIWDVYRQYDGIALSSMTHEDGSPWAKTVEPYKNRRELPHGLIIRESDIRDYYSALANAGRGS